MKKGKQHRIKKKKLLLVILSNLLMLCLHAQDFHHFNLIDPFNGLPKGRVTAAIKESNSGLMWVTTSVGLYQYDGNTFTLVDYPIDSLHIVQPNFFTKIHQAKNGKIWAGTFSNGVYVIDPIHETAQHFSSQKSSAIRLPENRVTAIFEDSEEQIWLGLHKNGVVRIDEKQKIEKHNLPSTLFEKLNARLLDDVSDIIEHDGKIWFSTMQGLLSFTLANDKWAYLDPCRPENTKGNTSPNVYNNHVRKIWIDKNQQLWLATWGGGLSQYDLTTGTCHIHHFEAHEIPSHLFNTILDMTPISDNQLLLAISGQRLAHFDTQTKRFTFIQSAYGNSNLSPANAPRWVYQDDDDLIWAGGTDWLGILSTQQKIFKRKMFEERLIFPNFDPVKPIIYAGVFYKTQWLEIDATDFSFTTHDFNKLIDKNLAWVNGSYFLNDSEIIIKYNRGFLKWNVLTKRFELIYESYLPEEKRYMAFLRFLLDDKNRVWLGSKSDGIICYDLTSQKVTHYYNNANQKPLIDNGWINCFFQDSKGRIWYGTEGGFGYFDETTQSFKNFKPQEQYKTDDSAIEITQVSAITEDHQGRIWLGSARQGIGYFEYQSDSMIFIKTLAKGDFKEEGIHQLIADKQGAIWASTYNGLLKINPTTLATERFGAEYGISGSMDLAVGNGQMIAARGKQLIQFNPSEIKADKTPPIVYLKSLQIFDKPFIADVSINALDKVELSYRENFFSFEFGAINYFNPKLMEFEYQLTGLDKNWISANDRKYVSYTNVGGGIYQFKVRARIADGKWSSPKTITVNITPPFWKTGWFLIGMFLLVGGVIFGIYNYRIQQIKEKEALKTTFNQKLAAIEMTALRAQMNPHFLFNCLNSIKLFILENDTEAAARYLTKFSKLIRLILQNSKQQLISLSDELMALRLYIDMEAMRLDHTFDYTIEVDINQDIARIEIPPLIIQPYVENAIWHGLIHTGKPNLLNITVQNKGEQLLCIIKDNGIGRAAAQQRKQFQNARKKSFGMSITADRIELINTLYRLNTTVKIVDLKDIDGQPKGTQVEIAIPLRLV